MGGDGSSSHHHQPTPSRLGLKSAAAVGEIVEVQGGHIVRSIGRKDRHSKVCTAKGPRDRRVRLAAHTAIQFYDVQDRLGYDRPSKAVDWLIKKAKSAIDELAQLPAWHPTATCPPPPLNPTFRPDDAAQHKNEDEEEEEEENHRQSDSGKRAMVMLQEEEEEEEQDRRRQQALHHHNNSNPPQISSFLPPSMDSDVIADTIKSFFPMGASGESNSSGMQFHQPDNQDLRLSLQSFQDPIMLHHHRHHHQTLSHHHHNEQQPHSPPRGQVLLSGIPLAFDGTPPWPDHHQFQRLPPWNPGADTTTAGGGGGGGAASATGGYMFNSPPPVPQQPLLQQLLGHNHNQFFQQRGPLQSSNTPSVRAWIDPSTMSDHNPGFIPIYPSSLSGIGFSGGFSGGFPGGGFHIPARIQGDEEEHDGYSDKPSSASSDSRH
ncbi:hypothetical protein ACP275_08G195100 [Erythranthe tilingii]